MKWIFAFLTLPMWAFAQSAPPENVEQLTPFLSQFMEALVHGDYKVVGGILLMTLMVVLRQYVLPTAKINREHLPFIVAIIAGLSFGGLGMLSAETTVLEALKQGIITAFVAGGIWDLLGKYLAKILLGESFKQPMSKG